MKDKERLLDKGIDLWCEALKKPFFDNGDISENGVYTQALNSMLVHKKMSEIDNIEERIELFRHELKTILSNISTKGTIWLDTDYHPCEYLSKAAEISGIPEALFPWKSHTSIHSDYVSSSFGYGAEYENYYPLSDDRWLVTTLGGSDIEHIVSFVQENNIPGIRVIE